MIEHYMSSIEKMQEQLFVVLAVAACGANLCGVVLNAFLHGYALPTQVCILCGIIILFFCVAGLLTKYKGAASVGILVTVVWIEFPFLYSFYGSIILIYFVLSILGIVMFFPRKFSLPFCSITIIWDVAVIIMMHTKSIPLVNISDTNKLIFTLCSYLIVAVANMFLLNTLILRYEKQKEELCLKNDQLDYVATHDPLTKLYNRGYLISEMEKRMKEDNAKFISVIMDIDDFKRINDTYGHIFGDSVLVTFAEFMKREVEGKGFAARFGGEEFMLIYDSDDTEAVLKALQNVARALEEYYQKEKQISVTFSGGMELYNHEQKIDDLIINVDNKLYQAKRNGKKQVVC